MSVGLNDDEDLRAMLAHRQQEHRDLDDVLLRITHAPPVDELQMRRLKKRKLVLKDEIARLEAMLIPDIIA